MSDRINIKALETRVYNGHHANGDEVLALVDAVEAAHKRRSIHGPLAETLKERAAAEQALDDALARFYFGDNV